MGIDVIVRTERGEGLSEFLPFSQIVGPGKRDEFPLLTHLDPYGNTIFNRFQVETLQRELDVVAGLIGDVGVSAAANILGTHEDNGRLGDAARAEVEAGLPGLIEKLDELCALSLKRPHRYLWFVGD